MFGLGRDEQAAARIQSEVEILQCRHRNRKRLQKLTRQANKLLRIAKIALIEEIAEWGFDFHGQEIRHRRSITVELSCSVASEDTGVVEQSSDQQIEENQDENGEC